jgi:hypothetical protein
VFYRNAWRSHVAVFEEEACDRSTNADNSDEVSDEESQAPDKFHCTSARTDTNKVRLHNESYLSMCFTWTCPIPLRLVCDKRLTNAATAPAKLKHLTTDHSHMTSKSADCFKNIKNIKCLAPFGNRTRFLGVPARSLVAIPTDLHRR